VELLWVNHAGFQVRTPAGAVLVDPWIEGSVFNDSWDLLSPTVFRYEDFAGVDYLWFSHGHPDHFNPDVLEKIAPDHRARITVLYQKTIDGAVAKLCRELGFLEVVEIDKTWHDLGHETRVYVEPLGNDSWCCIETPDCRIVNLNDCLIDTKLKAQHVTDMVGDVDVLLMQFSYANWVGNPDQPERRRSCARGQLEALKTSCAVLRPNFVMPTASFVYFSHAENRFMNDTVNELESTVTSIDKLGFTPIVLYPGERWDCCTPRDNSSAIARYEADIASCREGPFRTSATISFEALTELHLSWKNRLSGFHSRVALRFLEAAGRFPSIRVYLWDLERSAELSFGQFIESTAAVQDCDICLGSDFLGYVFKYDWGASDAHISGRRHIHERHIHNDDRKSVSDPMNWLVVLGDMASSGRPLGFAYILAAVWARIKHRIGVA